MIALGGGDGLITRRKHDKGFQDNDNILLLVLDVDYMMMFIWDNSSGCTIFICAFFMCVYYTHIIISRKKVHSDTKN